MSQGRGPVTRVRMGWQELPPETRAVILIAGLFVAFRAWLGTQSGFGFHRGWNEGHYALIAEGFFEHPLVPKRGELFVYNVPPLFPYLVAVSFWLFGESVLTARLPSVLAAGGTVLATYWLGWIVYDDRRLAAWAAGLLALVPYAQLFGGRAQTDMLMTFFFTASLAAIVSGYERQHGTWRLAMGGVLFAAGFAAKQPLLVLPGVVLVWLLIDGRYARENLRKTAVLITASAIASLPLLVWFYLNFRAAPGPFVRIWETELFHRTAAFAAVELLVLVALPLGITPGLIGLAGIEGARELLARWRREMQQRTANGRATVLVVWVVLYGAFAFYRAPDGHLYYVLPLAPPVSLLAVRGIDVVESYADRHVEFGVRTLVFVLLVSSLVGGTVVLYELSGEYSMANGEGSHLAAEAGDYLAANARPGALILTPVQYGPPIQWYVRESRSVDQVQPYAVDALTTERLREYQAESDGPVYVVYPAPSWGDRPAILDSLVYETSPYRFTVMTSVGSVVSREDKFTYYLNDRRLRIYRLEG